MTGIKYLTLLFKRTYGAVAQLGARDIRIVEAGSSNLLSSIFLILIAQSIFAFTAKPVRFQPFTSRMIIESD